jgi:5'-nucleotidase
MKRKILITNDDGYQSDGIRALVKAFKKIADIVLVAPSDERSCSSHSITARQTLRVKEIQVDGVTGLAVDGTPADTVILGLNLFSKTPVDFVISGINRGPNLGFDVFYSGTVGAAMEAAMSGIPAMAVSLSIAEYGNYQLAAATALDIFQHFESTLSRQKNLVLNVNIPDVDHEGKLKGWKITELADRFYFTKIKETSRSDSIREYIFEEEKREIGIQNTSDYWAVMNSEVSITPLRPNLTDWLARNDLLAILAEKS